MSERVIPISTYLKADDLIDIRGHLFVDGIDERIELPEKKQLILYNYSLSNGDILLPRNHDRVRIFLKPVWRKARTQSDFNHMLLKGESPEIILRLRLQVWCKNTRWCSNQIAMNFSEIGR